MEYLKSIREYEIGLVLPMLPRRGRILEIGAGAGWQVRRLSELGYAVEAIDTEGSSYEPERVWPVTVYDGHIIPFADNSFDAVFSSSVLEHLPHVKRFQSEILRVLKPGGRAVHVLPSASWRVWTSAAHYVWLCKEAIWLPTTLRGKLYHLKANYLPPRHGERGNSFTEIYTFSKRAWLKLFGVAGWVVERSCSNRLFYTGYLTFDSALPFRARHAMSYVLGSACNVFCLRKTEDNFDRRSPASGL